MSKHIALVPPFRESEVDAYFSAFERIAVALNWPKEFWSLLLRIAGTAAATMVAIPGGAVRWPAAAVRRPAAAVRRPAAAVRRRARRRGKTARRRGNTARRFILFTCVYRNLCCRLMNLFLKLIDRHIGIVIQLPTRHMWNMRARRVFCLISGARHVM